MVVALLRIDHITGSFQHGEYTLCAHERGVPEHSVVLGKAIIVISTQTESEALSGCRLQYRRAELCSLVSLNVMRA